LSKETNITEDYWTDEITPKNKWWQLNLKEIWDYRDLLFLFVRRDFVSVYKQTILGPIWFFIQPIFATLIYTVIFGTVAKIPTDGIPPIIFYMSGITMWNYFSECLTKTSNTFTENAGIFGKVYFPRLIIPLSVVISNLFKFGIQFLLLMCFYCYFIFKGAPVQPNQNILFLPILIFMMAGLGLGFGILFSSLTTKYRDLQFLIAFGVQLLMYGTPVVYPLSEAKKQLGSYSYLVELNPMTPIIEAFKNGLLGRGEFSIQGLTYTFVFMVVLIFIGLVTFHKVEKSFMDTV
jgi:lipopolysaccharide transport system permease protein